MATEQTASEQILLTLSQCRNRLRPKTYDKLIYSVNLLRKAESLANAYDPENGYYLAFSGGKDSQVLYHVAKIAGVKFKAHMNLTSVDPPEVIRFVKRNYPSVELIKPKMSIFQDAVQRRILPTMRVRWCCADYKESAGAGKVTLIGIRHAESARRAKRNEVEISSRKFSGTLEQLDTFREEYKAKKQRKKKATEVNITNAKSERTLGCISGKESLLISPIIHWSEQEVWEFLNALQIPHCELYDMGWHRIGCILCPMSSPKQVQREIQRYPHVKRNWLKAIKLIRGGGYSQPNTSGGTSQASTSQESSTSERESAALHRSTSHTDLPILPPPTSSKRLKRGEFYSASNWGLERKTIDGGAKIGASSTVQAHASSSLGSGCRTRQTSCQKDIWNKPDGQNQQGSVVSTSTHGFSGSSSSDGLTEEQKEDLIAENIFDWWTSKLPYKEWYAKRFLQQKINF